MYTKETYREYFAECRKYIKLKAVCKESNVNYSNFMKFLNNEADWCMSVDKLETLKQALENSVSSLIA